GAFTAFAITVRVYCPAGVPDVLATVTLTFTGLPEVGLMLADGAKLQVMPVAGVLQLRSTASANDPAALTCKVNCELEPGNSVIDADDGVPRVKSITLSLAAIW